MLSPSFSPPVPMRSATARLTVSAAMVGVAGAHSVAARAIGGDSPHRWRRPHQSRRRSRERTTWPSSLLPFSTTCALNHWRVFCNACDVQLVLPPTPQPGSELTMEPFRWDQRLFSILLRPPSTSASNDMPGGSAPPGATVPNDPQGSPSSHLTAMSEVTGGKCYVATCMKVRSSGRHSA
jgi:hypothetical protein